MSQVSAVLRRGEGRYFHWCPACYELHQLPDTWSFNGDPEKPTFSPSFRHSGKQGVIIDGRWTGEWVRGADGKAVDWCCHYMLEDGLLKFCGDCSHSLAGKTVPLPPLPQELRD